jgi:predicted RNase H-like HicB family nuclease
MTLYAVIIEGSGESYSCYVPDLPGCVATGSSVDEVEARLRDAIRMHIESLRTHGERVPEPHTAAVRTVEVA